MSKKIENIIIQAGGKGSRLETLTLNKPKCLVPINNLPIIFHLFKKFPHAKFKIIADYKSDVLAKYLKIFAKEFQFEIIATDKKGTCSGISDALSRLETRDPFMLIWCDLILPSDFNFPTNLENNFVGISKDFECRWSCKDGDFVKEPSKKDGVAGLFIFKDKIFLKDVPQEGEFVAWLAEQKMHFSRLDLNGCQEIGTMISYYENNQNKNRCRPFNKIDFYEDYVVKYPLDKQGQALAVNELNWYKTISKFNFKYIPQIHSFEPLKIERIKGKNIFEYQALTLEQKRDILEKIIDVLKKLHSLDKKIPATAQDCQINYIEKTFERLEKVRDLIPFAKDEFLKVNGKFLKNPLFIKDKITEKLKAIFPAEFGIIHGDPTFSNLMLKTDGVEPILIDPRGYFGNSKIYGDLNYDWAKLYYSVVGNYDQFNNKNFALKIEKDDVYLRVNSNNWEDIEDYFFLKSGCDKYTIKLLHAIIWLSLTTYSWEDYDSICGAFYNGVVYLNELL